MTVTPFETRWLGGSPGYDASRHRLFDIADVLRSAADSFGPVQGIVQGGIPSLSGLTVSLPQSVFRVRNPAAAQGVYTLLVEAAWSQSIAAQPATGSRIDLLYAQCGPDPNTADAVIAIATGVVAASPVAPSLPESTLLLGTITVPRSGTGSPSIVPARWYSAAPGAVLPWTTARGALPPLRPGQLVHTIGAQGAAAWQAWELDSAGNGSLRLVGDDVAGDTAIFGVNSAYATTDNQMTSAWGSLLFSSTIWQSPGSAINLNSPDSNGRASSIVLGRPGLYAITLEVSYLSLTNAHAGARLVIPSANTPFGTGDEAGPTVTVPLKVVHYNEIGSDGTNLIRAQSFQNSGSTVSATAAIRVRWLSR